MNSFLMNVIFPPWISQRATNPNAPGQPSGRSPTHSLQYYSTPGVFPPSARVDPKLKRQPRRPLHVWEYWKYAAFLAAKGGADDVSRSHLRTELDLVTATELTTDVLSHQIWGPRKKTWGIEMTIATSLTRGTGRHTALIDIGTIRMFMNIGGLVPLPSDALTTPVTFRVRRRNLRGILAPFDAAETGFRELSGEWVVGRKTWQRLQTEWKNSAINPPEKCPASRKERIVLYIHGGAYYLSSAAAQRMVSIPLAKYTDARTFAIDYRLAPETQFPGPLHDVVCAYLRLVEDLHIPPENIIVSGDSAGGGLTLALLMYLRDNGYPLPAGAILMSPWVDLTLSCESWESNAMYDVVPFPVMDSHMNPIALYLGEQTEEYLTHPYASPLFGSFEGLPPLLIQAGEAEVLRDEIILLAHKATLAGVLVRHEVYDDAVHVFQAWPRFSATRRAFESMRNFVHNVLPKHQTGSLQVLGNTAEKGMEAEIGNEKAVVVGPDGVEMKGDSAKQRFSDEPEVPLSSNPLPSPEHPGEENEPEDDGYWEVEDVWEEDNWLRGDGEDGREFLSCRRGVAPRRSGDRLQVGLAGDSKDDQVIPNDPTSSKVILPSFSSPGTPALAPSRPDFSDDGDDGYFLNPTTPPRRTKPITNTVRALGNNFSCNANRRDFGSPKPLAAIPSPLSPLVAPLVSPLMGPPGASQPITPPSSPNVDVDSSLGSRLYALPGWMLAPNGEGGNTFTRLKRRISQPVMPLTGCAQNSNGSCWREHVLESSG